MPKEKYLSNANASPDYIEGWAIDQHNTNKHHQLISVVFDQSYKQYRLDYSICQATSVLSIDDFLPRNFSDLVKSRHESDRVKANASFGILTKNVTDSKNAEIFCSTAHKKAMTYSFVFNPNNRYKIEDAFVKISYARMSEKMSYEEADTKLRQPLREPDFHLMHEFAAHLKYGDNYNQKSYQTLPFTEVMKQPTLLVQQMVSDICLRDGSACVHRIKKFQKNVRNNTVFLSTDDAIALEVDPTNWIVPITTSKKLVPGLNNLTFGHHIEYGENMCSIELHNAIGTMVQRIHQQSLNA